MRIFFRYRMSIIIICVISEKEEKDDKVVNAAQNFD